MSPKNKYQTTSMNFCGGEKLGILRELFKC